MKVSAGSLQRGEPRPEWLSWLSDACVRVTSNVDMPGVLQAVVDEARLLVGARWSVMEVCGVSGLPMSVFASGIRPGDVPDELLSPHDPNCRAEVGRALSLSQDGDASDGSAGPKLVGLSDELWEGTTHLMVPLCSQGEIRAFLHVCEKETGRSFLPEDETALHIFASHAAVAIANALVHREHIRARADMEGLINISPIGVLVFDAKTGELLSVNEETRRILGMYRPKGNSLGELLEELSLRSPDGRELTFDDLPTTKAIRDGQTVISDEIIIEVPTGHSVTTLVNARPVRSASGEILSVVATIQDITPLEVVKRQRAEFLRMVSHKMRTPLAAIKGSTATLLGSASPLDSTETKQLHLIIDEQAEYMRTLVNDFTDLTQIEAGTLSVTLEPIRLEELVAQARSALLRRDAGNNVEVRVAPDLPMAMADRQRILHVLASLLESAVNSSPVTSTIRVSVVQSGVYLTVSVEDGNTGTAVHHPPGAAYEDNGRSFQLHDMDLAICEGIVEAHGGRLWTRSHTQQSGNVLSFTVPTVDESFSDPGSGPDSGSDSSSVSRREAVCVLAVEHDRLVRAHLSNSLAEAGFMPTVTPDPQEIVRLIVSERPHLVMVDLNLPGTDSFDLMDRIGRLSSAPIIVLSGHDNLRDMDRAFESGAADYIIKPFTQTELVARVRASLRKRNTTSTEESMAPFLLGELKIDYAERLVTLSGRQISFTATEYKLLVELSMAAGRVLTHDQLLTLVWGPLYATDSSSLRTYIKELRNKLGDDARRPRYILTEPRVGYRMAKPDTA